MLVFALLASLQLASGSVMDLPCGYSFTKPIIITAPITLRGHGQGSISPIQATGSSQSCAINWLGAGDAIIVRLPNSKVISGVAFEDLTLVGNPKSGTGIVFEGGDSSTQMDNIFLDKVTIRDFGNDCVRLSGDVFLVKAWGVSTIACGGNGWSISGSGVSQVRCFDCLSLQNGKDGFHIDGASSSIEFFGTTSANNEGWGIRATSVISVFGGSFENNREGGITSDSPETVIIGAAVPNNRGLGISAKKGALVQGVPRGNNRVGEIKWK